VAGRIPDSFIEDLVDRIDLVDLIGRHVPLKRAGSEYKAPCPFHDERTPSFFVSPAKQFYHCFGCGAHGSALGFLMQYENLDFVEAVESLAREVGVDVPREGGSAPREASEQHGRLIEALAAADAFFRRTLRTHPAAGAAVDYLKGRGLTGEIARDFGLGFAPPGWDGLVAALGGDFDDATLERAGLVVVKDGGRVYDRFRNRIMFPIHDVRGRVIAFGGRAIGDEKPKYLNSPETPVFHKGRELYHLHRARRAAADAGRLIVVEGYMDVIALAQFGIGHAVATLGTAATREHCERLFKVTSDVVFAFDGDEAGARAALKAAETCLPLLRDGRYVGIRFLPAGEDPDSLVRRVGAEAFTAPADVVPVTEFVFDHLRSQTELTTIDGRARMIALAAPYLRKVPPGPLKGLMLDRLAELTRSRREDVERELSGPANTGPSRRESPPPASGETRAPEPARDRLVLRMLQILAQTPSLRRPEFLDVCAREVGDDPELTALIGLVEDHPEASLAALLDFWREARDAPFPGFLLKTVCELPEAGLEAEFRAAVDKLRARAERARRRSALEGVAGLKDLSADELARLRAEYASRS